MSLSRPESRVLLLEGDTEVADFLARFLRSEAFACEVSWSADPQDVADAVAAHRPDLLVVGLPAEGAHPYALLDLLRTGEATAEIPVVVYSASREVAEGARASYTVRAALVQPFDLADLLEAAHRALDRPPLLAEVPPEAEPTGVLEIARRLLSSRSRDALFRWVLRLRAEEPWRSRDDLHLGDVIDSMPMAVEALVAALGYQDADHFFAEHPAALERIQEHARTRRAQGIPLDKVAREYAMLREEVWTLFRRHLPAQLQLEDALALETAVNSTLARIMEATITSYEGVYRAPAADESPAEGAAAVGGTAAGTGR